MPALDNETIYCHLVDRADSDNLIVPGTVTATGGVTGDIVLSAGTASAPSLSFTGDPNTGVFSSGADQVALTAGGGTTILVRSDRFDIADGHNVAIGDTAGTKIGTSASQKIGFFNATPVVQQNVPLTTPSVQDVIDALVALGLVEQSDA